MSVWQLRGGEASFVVRQRAPEREAIRREAFSAVTFKVLYLS